MADLKYNNAEELQADIDKGVEASANVIVLNDKLYGGFNVVIPSKVIYGYVLKTDGTLSRIGTDSYIIEEYSVNAGDIFKATLTNDKTGASASVSVGVFFKNDDGTYTPINVLGTWIKNQTETQSAEFEHKIDYGGNVLLTYRYNGTSLVKKKEDGGLDNINKNISNRSFLLSSLNKKIDIGKTSLRILDIGNSFSMCSIGGYTTSKPEDDNDGKYLAKMVESLSIDTNGLSYYYLDKSGASYKNWVDVWNGADTCGSIAKIIGDNVQSSGKYIGDNGLKKALINYKWDVIIVHQKSTYSNDFEQWIGDGDGGYLNEYMRIIRRCQPNASIATLIPHSASKDNSDLLKRYEEIAMATRTMAEKYGIDIILPYGTAVQNLRASALSSLTKKGYCFDGTHLSRGIAQYVAAASTFEAIIAPRYGVSIFDCDWMPSLSAPSIEYGLVTSDNVNTAKMAALLSVTNLWSVVNPDDIVTLDL